MFRRIITKEFEILDKYIDSDEIHKNCLIQDFDVLDHYTDIKPYYYNQLLINNNKKYINASPIYINNEKYFIATQGPIKETIEDFWTD